MKKISRSAVFLCLLIIFMMLGCSLSALNIEPTPESGTSVFSGTLAPIMIGTEATAPSTESTTTACSGDKSIPAARYDIDTTIDYDNRSLTTDMTATYRNDTGKPLSEIVFDVETNIKPVQFNLVVVGVPAGTPLALQIAKYTLNGQRLDVMFNSPLDVDCEAQITLRFIEHVPGVQSGYNGKLGYFGYSDRQLNLGDWLPEIVPFVNGDWLLQKEAFIGEHTVAEESSFKAQITVQNADKANIPTIIGPGVATQIDARTWSFNLAQGRSFALSISLAPSELVAACDGDVELDLYYFPKTQPAKAADGTEINGPLHALQTAQQAINRYIKLWGITPYKRIVIVEGDFPDGMEFSGIVFVGHQWFSVYDGKPDSWLTLITAHEVAHQWFYSLVSDNQAQTPYLDEAFATYSEYLFMEDQYPDLASWWWQFRVKIYNPIGYVDSTVYDYQNTRLYINAVYLQGVTMIQAVRERIGDSAFFAWLQAYLAAESGKIASPVDLWNAMSDTDYAQTADIRAKFLHQPDPRHPPTATATITPSSTTIATLKQP